MHRVLFLLLLALPLASSAQPTLTPVSGTPGPDAYREAAERIIAAATVDSTAWMRLAYLCDTFGHRLSGSQALEDAIDWMLATMEADGLENVEGQPVMVPKWVRGEESAALVAPRYEALPMLGLGGSVATPPEGITADVLVVRSFEELERRAAEATGKIVVFNAPFTSYGETVRYRGAGASAAARAGAVASLIRSVGSFSMQTPHTGSMRYDEGVRQIPHAALTSEATEMLQRMQDRGVTPRITLRMESHFEGEAPSRNVIGEIRGRESPEEVVVIGGHIDSWDVGQGAVDDAGGVVAAWEAVRLLHSLGLRPRRTVRFVAWTNEENGLRGALAYRAALDSVALRQHVLAVESDGGAFEPVGFGFAGSDEAFARLEAVVEPLVLPILSPSPAAETGVSRGGGGADIGPLMREGVPGMSLNTDAVRYFWYHHTPADTVDKLTREGVQRCAAALAIMAYVVAEMPERLPFGGQPPGGH
ncbi:MAG TPA: M20/M25/M40 family metallo-hydrolase [Rubricoccaceae bacterium]|nr:M20/M25/M40 family metallo-hydrolase [Rubricoccaceae bacterium]